MYDYPEVGRCRVVDHLLPFFIVARTAAAYVAPSGLGAPRAMQAMMIASATRSALALHLAGTRAGSERDQSEIAADRRHPPGSDREVTGTWPKSEQGQSSRARSNHVLVSRLRPVRSLCDPMHPGCDPMHPGCGPSIAPGARLVSRLLHLCVSRRCVGRVLAAHAPWARRGRAVSHAC